MQNLLQIPLQNQAISAQDSSGTRKKHTQNVLPRQKPTGQKLYTLSTRVGFRVHMLSWVTAAAAAQVKNHVWVWFWAAAAWSSPHILHSGSLLCCKREAKESRKKFEHSCKIEWGIRKLKRVEKVHFYRTVLINLGKVWWNVMLAGTKLEHERWVYWSKS